MNHLLHSTNLFECYCWQNYTSVSNTDLYLSYSDLSYVFPGHYDSAQRGLTVVAYYISILYVSKLRSQIGLEESGKNNKSGFFLLGLNYTLRTCFESKKFLSKCCPELSNSVSKVVEDNNDLYIILGAKFEISGTNWVEKTPI